MAQKMLVVGGTYDSVCGKPSGIVDQIGSLLSSTCLFKTAVFNGGTLQELRETIYPLIESHSVILWMPNVSNAEEKVRDVKRINPKAILVSSKRNDNEKYSFPELISRALEMKANLTIEFSQQADGRFRMQLFDPLGNLYYKGLETAEMCEALVLRLCELQEFTRVPTFPALNQPAEDYAAQVDPRFCEFARGCADIFHNLIAPAKDTKRFLGNLSFRCQNGFPSFRGGNGLIYVSRRNVNKGEIGPEYFVPTFLSDTNHACYYGEHKPSVDTPVQLRLYKRLPQFNYMLHAHCYFDGAPMTTKRIPCGAIEEVDEILNIVERSDPKADLLAVNLLGHGCLLLSKTLEALLSLENEPQKGFVARTMPDAAFSDRTICEYCACSDVCAKQHLTECHLECAHYISRQYYEETVKKAETLERFAKGEAVAASDIENFLSVDADTAKRMFFYERKHHWDGRASGKRTYTTESSYRLQRKAIAYYTAEYDEGFGETRITCSNCGEERAIKGCEVGSTGLGLEGRNVCTYDEDAYCPLCGAQIVSEAEYKAGNARFAIGGKTMALVCKECGYKNYDDETIAELKKVFPNMEEHDIPYSCGACLDSANDGENGLAEAIRKENKKNQVLIGDDELSLLCPGCRAEVAPYEALKEIDIPVPAFCPRCGHKLHY